MTNVFAGIEINKELPQDEIEAINKLKEVDANNLKAALKNENIPGTDQTFIEMAEAFSTYVKIDDEKLTCGEDAPNRLKDMIDDTDGNDFAYFIYKISEFLNVEKNALEERKITTATVTHLTTLKAAILKEEIENKAVETEEKALETITEEEIKIKKLQDRVSKKDILDAVQTLGVTNPALANDIIALLKTGEIKAIQVKLGMEEGSNIPLYKKADGLFGKRTLENLKVGKVIEIVGGGSGGTSGSGSLEKIIVSQNQIDAAVGAITDTTIKKEVEGFIKEKNIKGLQEYIFNKTDGAHPKNSKKGSERDGILGQKTLEGIKALGEATITEEIVVEDDAVSEEIDTIATSKRDDDEIKKQLQESGLSEDSNCINKIKELNYDFDTLEYSGRYMIISDGKISIYAKKAKWEDMIKQEQSKKRAKLKEKKITELLSKLNGDSKNTWRDGEGNLLFKGLQGVTFPRQVDMFAFKYAMEKIIRKRGYSLENGNSPFGLSSKGNIYINTKNGQKWMEDEKDTKDIEEFKKNVSRDELDTVVKYLNNLKCWSAKEKFNNVTWPYGTL